MQHVRRRAPRERRRQREALVQRDGERVDVGGGANGRIAAQLFGRRVHGRAGKTCLVRPFEFGIAHETKVGQHGQAIASQQHVGGFDVAMHETGVMHGAERATDLAGDTHEELREVVGAERGGGQLQQFRHVFERRRPAIPFFHLAQVGEHHLQARAVDVLHLKREQVAIVDDAMDADDVLVMHARERFRFFEETLPAVRRQPERVRQHLERDFAVELFLARQIHRAHAAAAEFAQDAIAAQ
jgi:hypothetical protein